MIAYATNVARISVEVPKNGGSFDEYLRKQTGCFDYVVFSLILRLAARIAWKFFFYGMDDLQSLNVSCGFDSLPRGGDLHAESFAVF